MGFSGPNRCRSTIFVLFDNKIAHAAIALHVSDMEGEMAGVKV